MLTYIPYNKHTTKTQAEKMVMLTVFNYRITGMVTATSIRWVS